MIKTIGDAYMVLFQSSVAAVACALDCQRAFAEHNKSADQSMQIGVRIGVHIGDVILTEDDAFGEAVNVAARLEPKAPVGGVCITEAVYLQVRRKVHATGTDMGPVQLKNLPEKLRLFSLMPNAEHLDMAMKGGAQEPVPGRGETAGGSELLQRYWWLLFVGAAMVVFGILRSGEDGPHKEIRRKNYQELERMFMEDFRIIPLATPGFGASVVYLLRTELRGFVDLETGVGMEPRNQKLAEVWLAEPEPEPAPRCYWM